MTPSVKTKGDEKSTAKEGQAKKGMPQGTTNTKEDTAGKQTGNQLPSTTVDQPKHTETTDVKLLKPTKETQMMPAAVPDQTEKTEKKG